MGSDLDLVPLEGSILPKPRGWRFLSKVDPGREVSVTIHLCTDTDTFSDRPTSSQDEDEADVAGFERLFQASQHDIDAVTEYLRPLGFERIDPVPDQSVIEVTGTTAQCNEAFGVEMEHYDSRRGRYFGYEGEIKIPKHLDGIIETVSGLDNLVTLMRVRAEETEHETFHRDDDLAPTRPDDSAPARPDDSAPARQDDSPAARQDDLAPATQDDSVPRRGDETLALAADSTDSEEIFAATSKLASTVEMVGLSQSETPPTWIPPRGGLPIETAIPPEYTLHDPAEIARLYEFPEELDGTGQTIGIISLDGYVDEADISQYFDEQKLKKPNIEVVTIPSRGPRARRSYADDFEATMDVQVAGSVAPGATLIIFRVSRNTREPYLTALKAALLHPRRPSIISISYGSAEGMFPPRDLKLANEFLRKAVLKGHITICAASGDGGSGSRDHDKMKPGVHVNFPASSPYVLACGGTAIETSDGRLIREYAWNDHNQCRLATAGGISQIFPRPEYQKDLELPKNGSDPRGFDGRGVPDVAANACLTTGYRVLFQGRWVPNGGTSAAAPLWAGLIARLNQGLNRRLGFIHPHLYALAGTGAVRDITEGRNGYYQSGHGWDACTGLGTPNGRKLFDALKQRLGVRTTAPGDDGKIADGNQQSEPGRGLADLSAAVATANRSAMMAQHAAWLVRHRALTGFPERNS